MAAIDFPNPATQTPLNTFSPTSTPNATANGVTYTWDGEKWVAQAAGGGGGGEWTEAGGALYPTTLSNKLLLGTSTSYANYGGSGLLQLYNSSGSAELSFKRETTASGSGLGFLTYYSTYGLASTVYSLADGTHTSGSTPGALVFATTASGVSAPTERMRITNGGLVGINVTPTYRFDVASSAANSYVGFHENTANTADDNMYLYRLGANANTASATFLYCQTSTTQRVTLRGNGGIANYSANNVNLSDRNAKKDIAPAAGTWDCLKEWEIVNFRYKDQPDDADLNMGVIAQQVAESCPEVITVFQKATDDEPEKLGVKDQQMMWMAIKALQEAQTRIETLEAANAAQAATIAALDTRLNALEAN